MSALGSDDDCYFYFYSSCTKGDDCPFRHCQAALGTEIVCSLWREGRCIRDNCKFRHMESRINRGTIPCYWEDQPSGCLKPHCVFFHRKLRPNVLTNVGANEGLILPVSTTTPQTSPLTKVTEAKDTTLKNIPVESYSSNADDSDACPASIPIEPIVFSFDNEESDSESASSTPMKSTSNDSKNTSISPRKNLLNDFSDKKDDFGIKTLEQLKMEKIHKESDNFYKLDYDTPLLDPLQIKMKSDNFKAEIYPPKAEFLSIPSRPIETEFISIPQRPIETEFKSKLRRPIETEFISKPRRPAESEFVCKLQIPVEAEFTPKPIESEFISVPHKVIENPISATTDSKDQSFENERNSRNRLMKRKNIHAYAEKSIPPKKMISLKKTEEDDTLDFKIKTLEEIRKEKMNKIDKEKTPVKPTSQNIETKSDDIREPIILNNKKTPDINGKTFKKLKLKRQSNETLLNVNDVLQEADNSTDGLKKERNQMILHEVQNISEDQSKTDAKTFICKRKEVSSNSADEKSPKQLKVNHSTSPKNIEVVGESEEKQVRSTHLIIKRKISSSLLSEPSVSPPKELLTVTNVYDSIIPEQTRKITKEENHCLPKEGGDSHKHVSDNEKLTVKTSSVDDIDSFLLNEANVTLDYEPDGSVNESDDILLEIEQLLDS